MATDKKEVPQVPYLDQDGDADVNTGSIPGSICWPEELKGAWDALSDGSVRPITNETCNNAANFLYGPLPYTQISVGWQAGDDAGGANPRTQDYAMRLGTTTVGTPANADDLLRYGNTDTTNPLFNVTAAAGAGAATPMGSLTTMTLLDTNLTANGFRQVICDNSCCYDLVAVAAEFLEPFDVAPTVAGGFPANAPLVQGQREARGITVATALPSIERMTGTNIGMFAIASTAGISPNAYDEQRAKLYQMANLSDILVASGTSKFNGRDAGQNQFKSAFMFCRPLRICRACPGSNELSFILQMRQYLAYTLVNDQSIVTPYTDLSDLFIQPVRITFFGRESGKGCYK